MTLCLAALTNFAFPISSVAFGRDGGRLMTTSGFGPTPLLHDPSVRIWDTMNGNLLLTLAGHTNALTAAVFSPDGTRAVTTSRDNTAKLWSAASGSLLASFAPPSTKGVYSAAFSSDGTRAFVATHGSKAVEVSDIVEQRRISSFAQPNAFISTIAFSMDGARILTLSADLTAMILDRDTGKVLTSLEGKVPFGAPCAWNSGGSCVVTGNGNVARIWDASNGKLLTSLEGHVATLTSAAFSANGSWLATASADGEVRVWNARLENRSPAEVNQMVKARGPWQLVKGNLVPANSSTP